MSAEDSWEVIHDWLAFHHPTMLGLLHGPAKATAFGKLEKKIGHKLPLAFKESYRIHDGSDDTAGVLIGCPLMPLAKVADNWEMWADLADDDILGDFPDARASHPPGAVKPVYANRHWVPFAGDGQHYIALDFDPDASGTPGQVINAGRDDYMLHVIANSFEEFLAFVAAQFTAGRVGVHPEDLADPPRWLSVNGAKHDLITGLSFLLGLRKEL